MYIDAVQSVDRVTGERIVNEAISWGMNRQRAYDTVYEVLDRMPDAIAAAADQTNGLPLELVNLVKSHLRRVKG